MMFRVITFLLALTLGASAQVGQIPAWPPIQHFSGGAAYTGPGDVATFSIWYGLRAYSAATKGNAAINLCDNTGANCSDCATSASTGALNACGTRGANNCNTSGTCLIAKFYDQTGGGAVCSQATAGNMATFNATGGPASNPTAIFAGGQSYTCTVTSLSQPYSVSAVAERTGNFTSFQTIMTVGTGTGIGPELDYSNGTNTMLMFITSTSATFTASDSAFHAVQALFNGATSSSYVDGSSTAQTTPGTGPGNTSGTIGNGTGGNLTGRLQEVGWTATDNSANFSATNTQQHSFWGF